MLSILILTTRCRPTVCRMLNSRYLVYSFTHQRPTMYCRLTNIDSSVVPVRCVATITPGKPVSQIRKRPFRPPQSQLKKPIDHSERILLKLNQSPVSLPFVSFTALTKAIDEKLTTENALPLMKVCSRLVDRSVDERLELIDKIWQFLKQSHDLSASLPYGALIESYRCCGKAIDDPQVFLSEANAPKEVELYDELIQLMCANNVSIDAATNLLEHMKTIGLQASERAYSALIVGHAALTKTMEKSEEIILEMCRLEVKQTQETRVALIKANIECGNGGKAIELLKQHNDLDSYQLYSIIRFAAVKCAHEGVMKHALHLLPAPILNSKLIATELQNICTELLHASSTDLYYDPYELIIRHLPVPVFVDENTDEYGLFLIKEMLSADVALPRLLQFSENLIASERNTRALHQCCCLALLKHLPNTQDLLKILATKESLRPHYFWPLFAKAENESEIFAIIKLATETNVELDVTTIEKHILPKVPHTANDSMLAVKTLEEFGLKTYPLRTALVSHLLLNDRPHEALTIVKSFTGRIDAAYVKSAIVSFIGKNVQNFDANAMTIAQLIRNVQSKTANQHYDLPGEILYAIAHNNNDMLHRFDTSVRLIQDLTTAKVKISAEAADAVLNRMSKQRDVYALCVNKIRAMIDEKRFPAEERSKDIHELNSIQDMENHLIELESNRLNTRSLLRKLFLQCIKEKKFERALELNKKITAANMDKSPAMLAATMDLMTNTSNEREALGILKKLQLSFPQFRVDIHKIIQLATLLVQKNRLTDAVALLDRFASTTKNTNMNYARKNIWDLLQAVVDCSVRSKSSENSALIMLDKLVQMGYSEYTNINFGPIIREYIEKDQINTAVDEFERIATEHRSTPQLLTLLTLLIDLINSSDEDKRYELYNMDRPLANEMLRRIVNVARKVHKPEAANTHLLTAFSVSGNEQQIRTILMNPAMQFDVEQLVKNLEHQVNTSGNINAIIKLAKCNRGLRHEAINEENLYTLLLNRYSTENNHAAALELYTSLGKDIEFKMSTKLKRKFDDLFARNNIEIK